MRLRPSLAIDLGTVNTLIYVTGRGVVLDEPSVIARDTATGKLAAVGRQADALAGKEPLGIESTYPLHDGVIADLDATALMLGGFLQRSHLRGGPLRPLALVCAPSGATGVERRAVTAAFSVPRPHCQVKLVDEPVAAAVGAGVDPFGGIGALVLDVGGGTTELAVVAGGGIVCGQSLRLGGNAMDRAIVQAVKAEMGLVVGRRAAEELKCALGLTGGETGSAEVTGFDVIQRTLRTERVPGDLVAAALEHTVTTIVDSALQLMSQLPPDLASDVVAQKMRIAGGGALLLGLASRVQSSTGIDSVVADDPLRCVIRGAAEILAHGEEMIGTRAA